MDRKLLFVFLLTFFLPPSGVARTSDFRVANDGSIEVRGLRFTGFDSYFRSTFFREQGMRCGASRPSPAAQDLRQSTIH